MLYEDTSKPVPGLAEIQTSTKPKVKKEESRESLIPIKEDLGQLKDVSKDPGNTVPLESGEEDDQELSTRVEEDARGVRLKHATAKWVESHSENTLTDLSLTIKPGKLIAVIGPVGAGKSSLLHVLLRELPLLSGSVYLGGTVSYASQEPWLFAAMDRPRYNAVVRRCALDRDFSLFPHGDKTIVGERGVSLSGGQRARISLARSVYKRADIYLLDDPLSAVDAHVGRHLFESASGLDFASLLSRDEQDEEKKPLVEPQDADDSLHGSFRKRQMSIHSVSSVDNITATAPPDGGREEAELRTSGAVSSRVYGAYLAASGSALLVTLMVLVAVLAQLLGSGSDWWTSY
ncbi:putative multidrug resistance-associated protein lethal, partial [Operophtera brumata]